MAYKAHSGTEAGAATAVRHLVFFVRGASFVIGSAWALSGDCAKLEAGTEMQKSPSTLLLWGLIS